MRDYIHELLEAHQKIVFDSLLGNPVDFTPLREIAAYFEEINTNGTDEELWESVCAFQHGLLEES